MKFLIHFHKPLCKSPLGLKGLKYILLKLKKKKNKKRVLLSWFLGTFFFRSWEVWCCCSKGNHHFFFPPFNITQGWRELFLLVYSCVTGSRIRSTAGEPSKAGMVNWIGRTQQYFKLCVFCGCREVNTNWMKCRLLGMVDSHCLKAHRLLRVIVSFP